MEKTVWYGHNVIYPTTLGGLMPAVNVPGIVILK
jgi:hypothetical protein